MPRKKRKRAKRQKNRKKTKKRNPKTFRISILFVIAILFSIIFTEVFYLLYKVDHITVIRANMEIGNVVGIALGEENKSIMKFGIIPSGGSSTRFVTAQNLENFDLSVNTLVIGNIRRFLTYERSFVLAANETKMMNFTVSAPEDVKKGDFEGVIIILFKRV